jgi:hypothetical protein
MDFLGKERRRREANFSGAPCGERLSVRKRAKQSLPQRGGEHIFQVIAAKLIGFKNNLKILPVLVFAPLS